MIRIEKLNESNFKQLNHVDNSYITNEKVIPFFTSSDKLHFNLESLPSQIEKSRDNDTEDAKLYINSREKTVFFAHYKNKLAGQIVLHKYWNNFCSVEDLRISVEFRRNGIGKSLIMKACEWSSKQKLAGLRLETQDINNAACKFYNSIGFSLEGFDRRLYHGIPESRKEIALYWYLLTPLQIR